MGENDTTWDQACPHCGAEVQDAARRCWQCGQDFPAEGVDESEYRPSDDQALAGTASVLLTVGLATIVISIMFVILWGAVVGYFMFW
jgi:hypothetical protein